MFCSLTSETMVKVWAYDRYMFRTSYSSHDLRAVTRDYNYGEIEHAVWTQCTKTCTLHPSGALPCPYPAIKVLGVRVLPFTTHFILYALVNSLYPYVLPVPLPLVRNGTKVGLCSEQLTVTAFDASSCLHCQLPVRL